LKIVSIPKAVGWCTGGNVCGCVDAKAVLWIDNTNQKILFFSKKWQDFPTYAKELNLCLRAIKIGIWMDQKLVLKSSQ
jgi:hypothetical protein